MFITAFDNRPILKTKEVTKKKKDDYENFLTYFNSVMQKTEGIQQKKELIKALILLIENSQSKINNNDFSGVSSHPEIKPYTFECLQSNSDDVATYILNICSHRFDLFFIPSLSRNLNNIEIVKLICGIELDKSINFTNTTFSLIKRLVEEYIKLEEGSVILIEKKSYQSPENHEVSHRIQEEDGFLIVETYPVSPSSTISEFCYKTIFNAIKNRLSSIGNPKEKLAALIEAKDSFCGLIKFAQNECLKKDSLYIKFDSAWFSKLPINENDRFKFLGALTTLCHKSDFLKNTETIPHTLYNFGDTKFSGSIKNLVDKLLTSYTAESTKLGLISFQQEATGWLSQTTKMVTTSGVLTVAVTSAIAATTIVSQGLGLYPAAAAIVGIVAIPSLLVPISVFHLSAWRSAKEIMAKTLLPTIKSVRNMILSGEKFTLRTDSTKFSPAITYSIDFSKGHLKAKGIPIPLQKFEPIHKI